MRKVVWCAVLWSIPALARAEGAPAPPPEVKKTVDAFAGNWTFEGTLTGVPGIKDGSKLKETLACRNSGGGRMVSCSGKANLPGMGTVEDEALAAWDVETKSFRFVGMSSLGEIHDHNCTWKDDKTATCEPLALTVGGQPATVDLTMTWPDAKSITIVETTTMKAGGKMVYAGTGKRK
jgi:hypothetical protein